MAYDLAGLRDKIRRQGYKENRYSDAELNEYLNDAHLHVCGLVAPPAPFLRQAAAVAITSGNDDLTLPADFWKFIGLQLNGADQPLEPLDYEYVLRATGTDIAESAAPRYVYHVNDTADGSPRSSYKVWPVPDADYTATLVYLRLPPTLTADGDVPLLPEIGKNLIIYRTLEELHREAARWEPLNEVQAAFAVELPLVEDALKREDFSARQVISSGVYNLGGLRAKLRRQGYVMSNYSDVELNEYLNDAHLHVCGLAPWPFLRRTTSLTLTQGEPAIPLPADFWKIIGCQLDGFDQPLDPLDYEYILRATGNQASLSAPPQHIYHVTDDAPTDPPADPAVPRSSYGVWPVPNKDYTATLVYVRYPPALTLDTDVPLLPDVGKNLIVYRALEELHRESVRWDALKEVQLAFQSELARANDALTREDFSGRPIFGAGPYDLPPEVDFFGLGWY